MPLALTCRETSLTSCLMLIPKAADEITKNVCARIPLELANEMEQLGVMIGLNKREIITMAIHDFLEKARGVIDEFDALPEEQ